MAKRKPLEGISSFGTEEGRRTDFWGTGKQEAPLKRKFVMPPFSVLDARQGYWQDRKRAWLSLGIESELGRGATITDTVERE